MKRGLRWQEPPPNHGKGDANITMTLYEQQAHFGLMMVFCRKIKET